LKIIGLTGGYCVGKNEFASTFASFGAIIIDVDALGHQALSQAKEVVVKTFGSDIIDEDGSINRKRLGSIVFSENRVRQLEEILHPLMKQRCIELIEDYRTKHVKAVVLNAALLHRMNLDILCDAICFVTACMHLRFYRAVRRDNAGLISFVQRLRAQKDIRIKELEGHAEVFKMTNSRGKRFIHRQVKVFCSTIGIV